MVIYAGNVIEKGDIRSIFTNPLHPYTQGLFNCLPDIESTEEKRLSIIPGAMPDPMNLPKGCKFCDRCSQAMDICKTKEPEEILVGAEHTVKCHLYKEAERNE